MTSQMPSLLYRTPPPLEASFPLFLCLCLSPPPLGFYPASPAQEIPNVINAQKLMIPETQNFFFYGCGIVISVSWVVAG